MKRLSSIERAQIVAKAVNEFKTVFTGSFSAEGLTLQLKSIDCPCAINVFSILKKTNQLKKVSGKEYVFASAEPIYYKSLQSGLDEVVEARRVVQQKFHSKKKATTPKVEHITIMDEETSIQHAITLLKSNGYKISRPVITFEEV